MSDGSFVARQLMRIRPLWDTMLGHRFLLETRDGTITDETFVRWMRQDYWFVETAIPFVAALIPKAPRNQWEGFCNVIAGLEQELKMFEDRGTAVHIEPQGRAS